MRQIFVFVFAALAPFALAAQNTELVEVAAEPEAEIFAPIDASEVDLADLKWLKRPIVIFADTDADPRFQEQLDLLLARPEELIERDVVLIVDTDPDARGEIRTKLRPRGFMLTLIGKNGKVNLRKPFPWDVREVTRAIDKWPLRKQEIRAAKLGGKE